MGNCIFPEEGTPLFLPEGMGQNTRGPPEPGGPVPQLGEPRGQGEGGVLPEVVSIAEPMSVRGGLADVAK